ncbi:serine/arginine repetitive matrix protein 4-like [Notothenia coriiceps]|uniref:Serine/arginine repetitive matrix protein 4-like n=1 Tax=Notothenia coriiceps TaxID=8208 RepID=A0A6I9P7M8_9TELE|nr:PREDICTED: serine/arginine repetitive matrix protein 4-like [Notothenia coriiceps]
MTDGVLLRKATEVNFFTGCNRLTCPLYSVSARSPSFDEELSPWPKGKKKKRKSERKRKRKRSTSYSLSPLRKKKKKKKKKKSSKKSKRHRYTSKKSKHSSSSLKQKRKDERKHKKSSRTRRRRRYRRSESDSSSYRSSAEDRHHLQRSVVHHTLGDLAAVVEENNGMLDHTDLKWRPATKSVCKTAPKYRSILSTATVSTLQTSNAAGSIPFLSYSMAM